MVPTLINGIAGGLNATLASSGYSFSVGKYCCVSSDGEVGTWEPGTAYAVGQYVFGGGSFILDVQKCVSAGTSGGSAPTWNVILGDTTDGGVTWQDMGPSNVYGPAPGAFSVFDTSTSPWTLIGQLTGQGWANAEGSVVIGTPGTSGCYAIIAVMGGPTSNSAQVANAKLYVVDLSVIATMHIVTTLVDSINLASPENLQLVGTTLCVSNIFSTGTKDFTFIDASSLPTLTVLSSISDNALSGAVYSVSAGTTIFATSRAGQCLAAIDIPTQALISSLNLGTTLTGVDVSYYPSLAKWYAFVSGTGSNQLFSVDVTDRTAMSLVKTLTDSTDFDKPSNAHVVGTTLFMTAYGPVEGGGLSGITELDISDPTNPSVTSFTSTTTLGLPATVAFDHLFICAGTSPETGAVGFQTDTSFIGGAYQLGLMATGPVVANPMFSPGAGSYSGAQFVVIETGTSESFIRYTSDGSTPSETVGELYTVPVTVGSSETLNAIAYRPGWADSSVVPAAYVISGAPVATPTFSPAAGTYTTPQSVSIATVTSGATIRYTTDGSTPSESVGTVYSIPITISSATTLRAIAYRSGWTDSSVASAAYEITTAAGQSIAAQQQRGVGTPTIIPLTTAPNQSMTVNLPINGGTTTLNLTIYYNENGINGNHWVMNIADQYGNPLVNSVPLVTGVWPGGNILSPWDYLWIGSCFCLNVSGGSLDIPDASSLGSAFILLWDSN
jgi:hypothetical protein